MHLRILCERIEYLYGVIPVTPLRSQLAASRLAEFIRKENDRGISASESARAVTILLEFLSGELKRVREQNPFFDKKQSGAAYVIGAMNRTVSRFYKREDFGPTEENQLDLV